MTNFPKISIIICSYNTVNHLKSNLIHVLNQDYPEFEIILIDDSSTDNTSLVCQAIADPRFKYFLFEKQREGKKDALAFGISKASYERVVVTDADCCPNSVHWLSGLISSNPDNTSVILGHAPFQKTGSFVNIIARFENLLTALQYFSSALKSQVYMGVGRNMSYTKAFYHRYASHHDVVFGDDDLLINAVDPNSTSICLEENCWVYSAAPDSFSKYIKQKARHYAASLFYKLKDQILLLAFFSSWFVFVISSILLISKYTLIHIYILPFYITFVLCYIVFYRAATFFKEKDLILYFPLLYVIFLVLLIIISPFIFLHKKTHW